MLAAIVDIAFGDVEHESIGVLYGRVDHDRKQVLVTDCGSMEREPGTLDPFSVVLTEMGLSEAVDKKSKSSNDVLVGWFHTHLYDQPLPSADDAKVHEGIQVNSRAEHHAVGLICSLDAVNGGATSDCRRVTFTAFRGKSHEQVKRVTWSVRETPALSPAAVQCCFNTVKEMEKENRKLCNNLAGVLSLSLSQSCIKRKWLNGMWENYLIRLLQGTLPLLLDQLEQSRRNLRIQRAQINARLAQQRMKRQDAVGSSWVKEIRSSAKYNSGQSMHRINLSLTSSRAAASSTAGSGGGGGGASSKRNGAFQASSGTQGHSDSASAGRRHDTDRDLREGGGKERGSRPEGTRPEGSKKGDCPGCGKGVYADQSKNYTNGEYYHEGCPPAGAPKNKLNGEQPTLAADRTICRVKAQPAVGSSGNSAMAEEAMNSNAGGAVDANSPGSDSNPDAQVRGAFKSLDDLGGSVRAKKAEKQVERTERAGKRLRSSVGRSKSVNEPQQLSRRTAKGRQPQKDGSSTSSADEQSGPGSGGEDFQASSDLKNRRSGPRKYGSGKG